MARVDASSQTARIKVLRHRGDWVRQSRPEQLPPNGVEWDIWLFLAGRGSGKTRSAGEKIAWDTWQESKTISHVVAATHGDLRSVCYEGESGLLNIIPPECIKTNGYNRSLGEIHLTNGSIIRGYSAETPERARGPQCHRLWGDELAAWDRIPGNAQAMFDQAMFGLRLGHHSYAILTTTPKPIMLIKNLVNLSKGVINEHNKKLEELRVRLTTGKTNDNFGNLSRNFKILVSQYEGTRLGRQELDAEILDDIQGALWSSELIERFRYNGKLPDLLPRLVRIVVSIDPAATNNEGSDETGIVVAGADADGHGYVLEDVSGKFSPNDWALEAIKAYRRWSADCIIGEVNNGGDMVETTLRGVDALIPFKAVRASKGKVARAEPVSALYEQGKVHHVGMLPKLEDQLCMLTTDFTRTKTSYSPDRADAVVWCLTELILGDMDGQGIYEYYRNLNNQKSTEADGAEAEPLVLMGSNNPSMSTFFDRAGKKYEVQANGTIRVPRHCISILAQHGFRELEVVD